MSIPSRLTIASLLSATFVFSQQVRAQEIASISWQDQLALRGSVTLFTGPSPTAHLPFSNLISEAKSTVLMEMYHFTDAAVASSLIDSQKRGVKAEVILDGSSLKDATRNALRMSLDSSGVTTYASSHGFSITHSKAIVVDSSKAIVSSMNLTDHPEVRRDYGVVIEDVSVIREIESVFNADIENAKNQTALTPAVSDPHLLWSPINSGSKLHDLIASAKHSISAVAENVLDKTVISDLVAAVGRGVKVRVLSPACPLGSNPQGNYAASQTLQAGGADVRQMPDPATPTMPYLHGKMMVVDGEKAYVGSINYSYNSINKARELGIALVDSAVISGLTSAFNDDFSAALPLSQAVPICTLPTSP